MIRRIAGGLAALALSSGGLMLAGFGPLGAGSAGAATAPACSASATVKITPGLTLGSASQVEKLTATLTSCTGGPVTSGTLAGKLSGTQSCTGGTTKGTAKITWNNGKTSTLSGSLTISSSGSGTLKAKVTKGVFSGDSVTVSGSETHNGNCLTTPVTRVTLTGTVTF